MCYVASKPQRAKPKIHRYFHVIPVATVRRRLAGMVLAVLTMRAADTTVPPLRRNASGVRDEVGVGRAMRGLRPLTIAAALAASMVPAAAADLAVERIYARPPIVVFRWTGVYIGVHAGGGTGYQYESALDFPYGPGVRFVPLPATVRPQGWLAGGTLGANYQVDNWVIGFEAQASWTNLKGNSDCSMQVVPAFPPAGAANCTVKLDAMGTLAARLGWAFDRLLIYGKGGAAWTNDNWQMLLLMTDKPLLFSTNELRWGWMAGVGVEYAFTDSWSAKIEYNHMDLGTDSLRFTDASTGNVYIDANFRQRLDIVKVGVNYRWGVDPILVR
jgi:outer membrane immunogenic protein